MTDPPATPHPTTSREPATSPAPEPAGSGRRSPPRVSTRQLNLLRVGYLVMGVGLAVVKWPLLIDHEPWGLAEGTKECLLLAMSVLALLGVRYPMRLLPILLFEVAWKALWLGVVALPLWWDGELRGATRDQAGAVLWVVIIVAVIPWRVVVAQYLLAPAEPWRAPRSSSGDGSPR